MSGRISSTRCQRQSHKGKEYKFDYIKIRPVFSSKDNKVYERISQTVRERFAHTCVKELLFIISVYDDPLK